MKKDLFTLGVPFVAGGIVFLLAGFTTGLMTTSSDARLGAQNARVDARASICQKAATAHFAEIGEATPDDLETIVAAIVGISPIFGDDLNTRPFRDSVHRALAGFVQR